MRTRSAHDRATTGALVVLGVGSLVAASLARAPAGESEAQRPAVDLSGALAALDTVVIVIGVAAAAIVSGVVVWAALRGAAPRDRRTLDVLRRSVRFVLLVYVIVAVLTVAVPRLAGPARHVGEEGTAAAGAAPDAGGGAWWPLALVVAASGGSLAALRLLKPRQAQHPDVTEATRAALGEALDALDEAASADDVIIAAYQRMEAAFRQQGLVRGRSETTAEFVRRVVATVTVDQHAARSLATIYERARFSNAPPSDADRAAARSTLARLLANMHQADQTRRAARVEVRHV